MKKDAISTGLFIAIGFLCVAIVIAILIPLVRDVINAADDNRPTIPGVSLTQPLVPSQTAVTMSMTHVSV
ncbi:MULTISPECIES: hypothetical protein [Paenibacillus]|uniref:Uncharacterized protein n=1 Tax=Paenibacillus odorifer TaxID=189426 RepID=A0A1R0WZW0_9BACL|nr:MULTISPECIES: hypothetical protein [Paenibacillus]AIQ72816.1 hypothetical protein PODO_05845 [Paenibacillus odorifer]ETT60272.1 hypothetical protein C171_13987 [Paenibacillus sp. FSL H8-237]OMC99641.1 hypothetical protein BJP46_22075 [Paenibacillus odorifer]OMD02456.1 hypothetical protein BJP49_25935 [Paenibacillus odorifer]OMD15700.1 hypothetical protein BJP47_21785 [Paenibacillus odorifer]